MLHDEVSVDQRFKLYFNQGLTQAEVAQCLSVRDNIQVFRYLEITE